MPAGFPSGLNLTPNEWPDDSAEGPGAEDRFLPRGFLVGPPSVIFPYNRDIPPDHYYGAETNSGNPFKDAPLQDPCGGTVYFETTAPEWLKTLMNLMGIRSDTRDYLAFGMSASDPVELRFLDQIKILSHAAVRNVFRVEEEKLPEPQELTVGEAVTGFVQAQADKWEEPGYTFSPRLSGAAGGDGDWAKEALAFGLHVENCYWGVYRIWSRPWLVTK